MPAMDRAINECARQEKPGFYRSYRSHMLNEKNRVSKIRNFDSVSNDSCKGLLEWRGEAKNEQEIDFS